ncbi:hypothetical protein EG68_08400 [Paragonimus skrjabini miyazakii]|uniref:Uncharacterized protein n=1 Tax=Paragonimus skrjabini miyazakii TaxID=59628 RepID=A0A8S9YKF4_9TREM|nr:hypothetical protein EG68_08400 [Paragonimus skrjabini miyazakii]
MNTQQQYDDRPLKEALQLMGKAYDGRTCNIAKNFGLCFLILMSRLEASEHNHTHHSTTSDKRISKPSHILQKRNVEENSTNSAPKIQSWNALHT